MSKKEIEIILDELKELKDGQASLLKDHIIPMRENLSSLNTKATLWGAISGTVAAAVLTSCVNIFKRG